MTDMAAAGSEPPDGPAGPPQSGEVDPFLGEKANPPNEAAREADTPAEGLRFKSLRERGRDLFAKWSLRGPGGPPNCNVCGLPEAHCACPGGAAPGLGAQFVPEGEGSVAAPSAVPRDPLIIRRSIAAIGRAVRKFGDKIIFQKALRATGDKTYAAELVKETSATDDECDALGEVTDILLKELGLDTKYVPLAAALTIVAGGVMRYAMVNNSLNQVIAEKWKQPQEAPKK